jgi:hypothetical protein
MYPMIYDAVCSGTPRIMRGNWPQLAAEGWRWVKNMADNYRESNLEYLDELIAEHGRDRVAVGWPFVIMDGPSPHNDYLVGVYVRDCDGEFADTFPTEWLAAGE